jgi:type II secretion system protein N
VKRLLIGGFFLAVLFCGIWLIAIPDRLFVDLIGRSLEGSGIRVDVIGIKKGLLYNFRAEQLIVRKSGNILLTIDNVEGKLDPLALIILKLPLRVSGNIGGAGISCDTDLLKTEDQVDLRIENAEIKGIPFVGLAGLKGSGLISGTFRVRNNTGDAKFFVRDLKLDPVPFSGIRIPLDMFQSARAALTVKSGTTVVDSFTLEGAGIYARITGEIVGNTPNLVMELMPERSLAERMPVFALLKNFEVSPGHYSIAIKNRDNFLIF